MTFYPNSPYAESPSEILQFSIDNVLQVAVQNFGKPYSEGSDRLGPNAFDCSSYVWYCYLQGAGIDIGQDTAAQLGDSGPLTGAGTLVNPSASNLINTTGGPPYTYADLQPGDLIFWGNSYSDVNSQHVEMFAGTDITYNGTPCVNTSTTPVVVAEYQKGDVAHPSHLGINPNGTFSGDDRAPVLAVLRYQQAILTTAGVTGSGPVTVGAPPTSNTSPSSSKNTGTPVSSTTNLTDPRNNLPFSSYFMSQRTNFEGYTGVTPLYAERHLVRGGIALSASGGIDPKGQFTCYFMMNPATISVDYSIDTTNLPQPQANTAQANSIPVGTTNAATITFQVIFNRMYEVWRGDTVIGDSGPSVIGCRWDIRALERLLGVYDNIDTSNPVGINGVGNPYPHLLPVQAVFGSQNSVIFSGYITSLSYEYTLFSKDMVPIESYATVGILAMWLSNTGKDIINSIVHVPSDYYTPAGSGKPQVSSTGPLSGFMGIS